MKPMLRFSIAAVTAGMCFLMLCAQTQKDAAAAQGRKPVMMYRFYTGKDAPGAEFGAFHPGPRRPYLVDLAGHEEVEFSGGERITLNPGDIELIEDLAPTKGHRNRNLGPEDRLVLWVPIADQTVVRNSILN